ncbi:hypothetical protein D9M72_591350 [compost metagenome]
MNATARPDSSVRNDWPWSLVLMMFMPSFWSSFILRSRRSDVVPAVVTMFLPFRSAQSLMPASFFTMMRVPMMKMELVNATCFWRSRLLVVEPHSMSMVPFCSSVMRFCEVIGISLTCRFGSFSWSLMASTIFMLIS